MSANTIPDDVMRAADNCIPVGLNGNHYRSTLLHYIATALFAERQRCAAIVRSKPISETADRFLLEAAILNPPSAASSRAEQTGVEVDPPASAPVTQSDWITWNGGECPVGPEARVLYRVAGGSTSGCPDKAAYLRWGHIGSGGDIIAYRVVPNLTHEEAQ